MSKIKTQIGTAITADFHENTWTFKMPSGFSVAAGKYAIVPKENYNAAFDKIAMLNSLLDDGKAREILKEIWDELSHNGV
jgi:hypothetical protein